MGRYDKLRGMIKDTHKERKKKVQKVFPLMFSEPKTSSKAKAEFNKSYAQSKARQTKYKSLPRKKYFDVEKKGYTLPKKWRGEGKNEMRISEMSKSKLGRGILGATTGASKALFINPQEEKIPKKVKESTSYKVGDFVGSNLTYLIPAGAVEHTAGKVGAKVVASKAGKNAVKKLATKKAFKETGKKGASEFLERVTKEAVRDIPAGALVTSNRLLTEGKKFGSEEYNKEMALNTALDVGIGGAIEWAPVVAKGLKNKKFEKEATKEAFEKTFGKKKKRKELEYIEEVKSKTSKKELRRIKQELTEKFADNPKLEAEAPTNKPLDGIKPVEDVEPITKTKATTDLKNVGDTKPKPPLKNKSEVKPEVNKKAVAEDKDMIPLVDEESVEQTAKNFDETINNESPKFNQTPHEEPKVYVKKPADYGQHNPKVAEDLALHGGFEETPYIPKKTDFGETSKGFETVAKGGKLDEPATRILNVLNSREGLLTKSEKVTHEHLITNARTTIGEYKGDLDRALNDYKVLVENETLEQSPKITALEVALTEEIVKNKRYDIIEDVISSSIMRSSMQAKGLVARKLFNELSPAGRVVTVQKMAKRMSKDYGIDIKISDESLKRLMEATDDFEFNKIKNEIVLEMWNKVPPTTYDKLTAWRYTCMLANPRTHVRNMFGNIIMYPLRTTRNVIAAGLEQVLVKDGYKTKTILDVNDKPLLEIAKENYRQNHHAINDNAKFNDFKRPQEAQIFKSRLLEKLRKFNTKLLEKEDEMFFKPVYEKSYAEFLKANKFDVNNPSDELLLKAEEYAMQEALEATYRNENVLADFISSAKKNANLPLDRIAGRSDSEKAVKKAWSMLVDTMVPFSKTPTNVLARSLDYSPVGLTKGLYKMVNANGDSKMLVKGISDFSAGLTGTGLLGVGLYLGHSGIATGSMDKNDAKAQFMKENGAQNYSLNINLNGETYTYSLDWATPACIPFFIGVEASKGFENLDFSMVIDSLSKMTDPVFSLSMLSGLQQSLDTSYGSGNPVVDITTNIVQGRMSQYIPTIAGQFARTMVADRKIATSTSEGQMAKSFEYWFRNMLNRVPWLSEMTEPYVDTMGEKDTKNTVGDYALATFNNFLNPGVLKKVNLDKTDKELLALGEELGSEGMKAILPKRTSTYEIKNGDKVVRMNEKELTLYKQRRGQYSNEKLKELMESDEYKKMSNEDKQKAIANIYSEAKFEADKAVLMSQGVPEEDIDFNRLAKSVQEKYTGGSKKTFVNTYKGMKGYRTHVAKHLGAIMNGASFADVSMVDKNAKRNTYGKAVVLYKLGITPETVDKFSKGADYNGNGRRSVDEVIAFLNGQNLSREQKRVLFDVLVRSKKNPY